MTELYKMTGNFSALGSPSHKNQTFKTKKNKTGMTQIGWRLMSPLLTDGYFENAKI